MTQIRRAKLADAGPLAGLQAEALRGSMLSLLGIGALVRYYQFAIGSTKEAVWSAVDQGNVVGGCVLSDEPDTVLGRFARHAPLAFARDVAKGMIGDTITGRVVSRFRDGIRGEQEATTAGGPHAPEVTQIFTDRRRRGEGIGALLLRTCEDALRARGVRAYYVHTERDDNEAGIRFYTREGFVEIGRSRSFGVDFLVMKKTLVTAPGNP